MVTISTYLTIFRIILTPLVICAMVYSQWGIAWILFMCAAVSDLLDGYFARLLNQRTRLGACLDPIADKLLLLSVFGALAFITTPLFVIPKWFVLLILCKELVLVVGFVLLALVVGRIPDVHPSLLGKITTLVQVLFIMWLFACYFFQWLPIRTYYSVLTFVSILVIVTLVHYMSVGVRILRNVHAQ